MGRKEAPLDEHCGEARRRCYRLGELAERLRAELAGPAELEISGVGSVSDVQADGITFAASAKHLPKAEASPAAAVIIARGLSTSKPALISDNPRLSFGLALALFEDRESPAPGVHPTAQVHPTASLGREVAVGAYCVVGEGCVLGDMVVLHAHCALGRRCRVGAGTVLFPRVTLYEGTEIGERCRIHAGAVIGADGFGYAPLDDHQVRIPQVGTVEIEDEVEIGANTCIDRATTGVTRIGSGTKIDNLVQVGHNVRIGRNCIICGQVGLSGSVTIGDGVRLGGQAGVADHMLIADRATIGAQSGVISDVPECAVYSGFPAQPHRQHLRMLAALKRLPEMLDRLRHLRDKTGDRG